MPFFVIKKGLVLLEWKYFPTPKILDPNIFTYGRLQELTEHCKLMKNLSW
jgi:hypothetical protein